MQDMHVDTPEWETLLAVETHENWLEAHRYLNMNDLRGS